MKQFILKLFRLNTQVWEVISGLFAIGVSTGILLTKDFEKQPLELLFIIIFVGGAQVLLAFTELFKGRHYSNLILLIISIKGAYYYIENFSWGLLSSYSLIAAISGICLIGTYLKSKKG